MKDGSASRPAVAKGNKVWVGLRVGSASKAYPSPVALSCCPSQNIFFSEDCEKAAQVWRPTQRTVGVMTFLEADVCGTVS